MMTSDPRRLLGGWATDTLTEAERRELLRAALDDQALFDDLLQEEGLRGLLEDPAARHEILTALERPGRGERFRAWLSRPATVADLATVAAVLVVALVAYGVFRAPAEGTRATAARPAARGLSPATIARLAELPARETGLAAIEVEGLPGDAGPRVHSGEALAVRVSVRAPGRVVLVERRPDGSAVQVWAGDGPASLRLPLAASPLAGRHLLRLVVAPSDLDLTTLPPAGLDGVAARLTIVDLPYEVAHP
jgi:hypothetical protein